MAATPTVAAIGAAELFVLLMTERDAAVPPITSGDVDIGFVNEFHVCSLKSKAPTSRGFVTNQFEKIKRV
jgi:hypothetical protein